MILKVIKKDITKVAQSTQSITKSVLLNLVWFLVL